MLAWTNLKLGKNIDAEYYFNVVLLYSPKDASANEGISYIKRLTPNNELVTNAFYKSYELLEKLDYKGAVNSVKAVYDKSSYFINFLSYFPRLNFQVRKALQLICSERSKLTDNVTRLVTLAPFEPVIHMLKYFCIWL